MKRTGRNAIALILGVALASAPHLLASTAQMEKRDTEQYVETQFASSRPAVSDPAPDMDLRTLDGKSVSLRDYRGRNIVVIKAGYT